VFDFQTDKSQESQQLSVKDRNRSTYFSDLIVGETEPVNIGDDQASSIEY